MVLFARESPHIAADAGKGQKVAARSRTFNTKVLIPEAEEKNTAAYGAGIWTLETMFE
jgi:hypothetical protein